MFALRSFARALPRAAVRAPVARFAPRCIPSSTSFIKQTPHKAFSTSFLRREPAGESDSVLSAKLAHERQLEVEERDPNEVPAEIQEFLNNSSFQVEEKPGSQIVALTRQFGNETIKIEFNIAELNEIDEELDQDFGEDSALEDEGFTTQGKRTINQSGTKGGKIDVAPEDSIAPSDNEDGFEEMPTGPMYPLNLHITVTKQGAGATYIRGRAEDGYIHIDNVNYISNPDLLEPSTPDQVREAENMYEGPPFENLDEELQTMMTQYLEERDINTDLANFVPQYVEFKEQKEYVRWLDNLKKFIDA